MKETEPTCWHHDLRKDGKLIFRATKQECEQRLAQVGDTSGYTITNVMDDRRGPDAHGFDHLHFNGL
jgi:hypothetical protein